MLKGSADSFTERGSLLIHLVVCFGNVLDFHDVKCIKL